MGPAAVSAPRTADSVPNALKDDASEGKSSKAFGDATVFVDSNSPRPSSEEDAAARTRRASIGAAPAPFATRHVPEVDVSFPGKRGKNASARAQACAAGVAPTPESAENVTPALTAASLDSCDPSAERIRASAVASAAIASTPPAGLEPGTFTFTIDSRCRWTREYATATASCAISISVGGTRRPRSVSSIIP